MFTIYRLRLYTAFMVSANKKPIVFKMKFLKDISTVLDKIENKCTGWHVLFSKSNLASFCRIDAFEGKLGRCLMLSS